MVMNDKVRLRIKGNKRHLAIDCINQMSKQPIKKRKPAIIIREYVNSDFVTFKLIK